MLEKVEVARCPDGEYKGTEDSSWVICKYHGKRCTFYPGRMSECDIYMEAMKEIPDDDKDYDVFWEAKRKEEDEKGD